MISVVGPGILGYTKQQSPHIMATMFGSNTLSLPASFAHDHRPLRLSSESARPQPTGQCHFQLLHPAAKNQICACQIYQHNRSAPGNVCDCGHSACYHGAAVTRPPELLRKPSLDLEDKVKNLEVMILAERKVRDSMIAQERATWERDIRILREALAPFYRSEEAMQRKLDEIQHRLDGSLEEQLRLRERFEAMHEANMSLGKQYAVSEVETSSIHGHQHHIPSPPSTSVHNGDDVPGLTSSDERSSSSSFSRNQTPSEAVVALVEPESPRSSGILNLVNFPRPAVPPYMIPRRPSPQIVMEEPRSSGFLGVDIREHVKARMNRKQSEASTSASPMLEPNQKSGVPSMNMSPPSSYRFSTPRSLPRPSPPVTGYINTGHTYEEVRLPKKRKHQATNMMALDVLADVSAASPLIS